MWVRDFTIVAKPLYNLLKKGTEFVCSEDCDLAMDTLKEALINTHVLSTLNYAEDTGDIVLAVDASGEGWGAILQQV